MDQKKIDWTMNVTSRLINGEVGDQNKIKNLQFNLKNNFEISDKDVKYLQKQLENLEKKEEKENEKICPRCNKKLGFMRYSPDDFTGYRRKTCLDCFNYMRTNHTKADGKYIEGSLDLKSGTDIKIHANNFDAGSLAIISKKTYVSFPIENLKTAHPVFRQENSFRKKIITAGREEKETTELLEIKFDIRNSERRIIVKTKNVEHVAEDIYKLQRLSKARDYKETFAEQSQPQKEEKIEENIGEKYGKIIKQTPSGQYYGGHKAYLAGGTFGDAQNGSLILTEKYIVFFKNAMRESKRWRIEIPLDRVVVGDWTIDEKVRRKSMVGGGAALGFGLFGGGGTIHDTGKSHDIVVPYIDENGIEQAPRFGVVSLGGNAIREWAKIIYDALVKIQKEKKLEVETKPVESKRSDEDPIKILKLRLAKGEITKEEYEELKELLD